MTRISAIGIALLCILCVTSCGLKSRQTTTESSSETGYSAGYDRHGSYHCTAAMPKAIR